MTPVRREKERFAEQKESRSRDRRRLPSAVSMALGWTGAALGVYAVEWGAHGPFAGASRGVVALVKIAVIIVAGAIYARTARRVPSGLVLTSGIAWLVFSIAADVITGIGSASAYQLLGNPTAVSGILRGVTILAWLSAPALLARGGLPIERREDFRRHR